VGASDPGAWLLSDPHGRPLEHTCQIPGQGIRPGVIRPSRASRVRCSAGRRVHPVFGRPFKLTVCRNQALDPCPYRHPGNPKAGGTASCNGTGHGGPETHLAIRIFVVGGELGSCRR
jgi:hypothetical protein